MRECRRGTPVFDALDDMRKSVTTLRGCLGDVPGGTLARSKAEDDLNKIRMLIDRWARRI